MQNFFVQRADGHFRSSSHPFKLNFSTGTIAKEIDLPEVPPNIYHFTSFDEILSGKACTDVLVDVIGQFIEKVQYYPAAARKKVVISLKDQFGKVLSCTLWEAYASKMVSFIENHSGGPIVIILTLAKIHEAIDNYPITNSNSKWGSTLLINENVKEIEEFKSSLDPSDVYKSGNEIMSQISGSSQFSSDDAFFYKAEVKRLSQICSLTQETQCCAVAKIENVLAENGWSYDHCIKCNKKAQTCGCKEGNPSVVPRFKVEVMVSDKDDSAKFVLWDNECVELLSKKAVDLRNQMIADGELNPMVIPQAFYNLEGKTLAFKIKVQPRYRSSSVIRVSQKQHIIEEVLQKLTVEKEPCTIDKGKSVCSVEKDDYQCETVAQHAPAATVQETEATEVIKTQETTPEQQPKATEVPAPEQPSAQVPAPEPATEQPTEETTEEPKETETTTEAPAVPETQDPVEVVTKEVIEEAKEEKTEPEKTEEKAAVEEPKATIEAAESAAAPPATAGEEEKKPAESAAVEEVAVEKTEA